MQKLEKICKTICWEICESLPKALPKIDKDGEALAKEGREKDKIFEGSRK